VAEQSVGTEPTTTPETTRSSRPSEGRVSDSLTALVFAALSVVVHLVLSLREAAIGAAHVCPLLDATDTNDAAAFAVVTGITATLVFNAVRVITAGAIGVEIVGSGAGALATVGAGPEVPTVLCLVGLFSVLFAFQVGHHRRCAQSMAERLGGAARAMVRRLDRPNASIRSSCIQNNIVGVKRGDTPHSRPSS